MSPFKKYRHILFEGYSTAESLQQFVLSLYNGASAQFRGDSLSNFDQEHFEIFVEFARSYHANREEDPEFMAVCREMWAQRRQWGKEHLERIEAHRKLDPKAYDEGERAWREELRWLEDRGEALRAKGWIDDER
jgi:hypothetical protein